LLFFKNTHCAHVGELYAVADKCQKFKITVVYLYLTTGFSPISRIYI